MKELYIDNELIELVEGEEIAITYQANELGEVEKRQADFSHTFKAVKTKATQRAFGYVDGVNINSTLPYRLLPATVKQSGSTVSRGAFAKVQDVDDHYNIKVSGGAFNFFRLISDKKLSDLNLDSYIHDWSETNSRATYKDTTSGLVYPIINYGSIQDTGNEIDVRHIFGAFYLHTLIDLIISEAGYTATGGILDDSFYKKCILPFSKDAWENGDKYKADNSFESNLTTQTRITNTETGSTTIAVQWGYVATLPGTEKTIPSAVTFSELLAVVEIDSFGESDPTSAQDIYVGIAQNGSPIAVTPVAADGTYSVTATNLTVSSGDILSIIIEADYDFSAANPAPSSGFTLNVSSAALSTVSVDPAIVWGGKVYPEAILPDWTQKKLFITFCQLFGVQVYVHPQKKLLYLTSYTELVKNRGNALDWSKKLDRRVRVETRIGSYAQTNHFKYKEDDLVSDDLGNGSFVIDDTTLDTDYDLFTLPFAASDSANIFQNLLTAKIPFLVADEDTGLYEAKEKPEQRFLYVDDFTFADITYVDEVTSGSTFLISKSHKIGRFIDRTVSENLSFDSYMKSKHYGEIINILTRAKKYTVLLRLTVNDVNQVDFTRPVYLSEYNSYFIINKIKNFTGAKSTEVELIKINIPLDAVLIAASTETDSLAGLDYWALNNNIVLE